MNPEKENALNESLAMTKLTIDLLNQKKKDSLRLWIVIIIMIIVNLVEAGLFVWYELQYEDVSTVTTTTTTEDIDQNAESVNKYYLKLKAVGFDSEFIYEMQEHFHKKYK